MKENQTISQRFQVNLAIIVVLTLAVSTLVIFLINTFINKNNYSSIIASTLTDVEKDIEDTTDANMLAETNRVKAQVVAILTDPNTDLDRTDESKVIDINDKLRAIVKNENLSEMSIVDKNNIVVYSSYDEYIRFDMNSNPNTIVFDVLNHGTSEVVQPVRANAYNGAGDYAEYNKYAGVPIEGIEDIGYLQVAINPQQFQKQVDNQVNYIAANRHIGQSGMIIIANIDNEIVSYAGIDDERYNNVLLGSIGITFDKNEDLDKTIKCKINGTNHMVRIRFIEGYYIIGAVPTKEVQSFRDRATIINVVTEVIIFLLMFLFIRQMINSQIVSKIHNINTGLQNIISGKLDTQISEYSTTEFATLSNDINSTVSSLKDYMNREQEKIKQELDFAKSIQIGSLPKLSKMEKYNQVFELYATMDTAKEVGGDFYDFYMINDKKLAFLIADVSGKGVPAALYMMICKTMLKNLIESGLSINDAFNKASEALCENSDTDMFTTVWMGILDLETGDLEYINAGHNPPLIFNDKGEFEYLKSKSGFVLTGVEGLFYKKQKTKIKPGDKIFLYTDGVTEANNINSELFGEKRLLEYVNSAKDKPMKDILLGLKENIDTFVGEATQFDDISMLGIKYNGMNNKN